MLTYDKKFRYLSVFPVLASCSFSGKTEKQSSFEPGMVLSYDKALPLSQKYSDLFPGLKPFHWTQPATSLYLISASSAMHLIISLC